jgi:hypothetical protein
MLADNICPDRQGLTKRNSHDVSIGAFVPPTTRKSA